MNELEIFIDTFSYKDIEIFHDNSFKADRGTVTGITGKNGAGKSTLVNIMTGLLDSSAKLYLDGSGLKIGYNRHVLYLPYEFSGMEYLTLYEIANYYSMIYKIKFEKKKFEDYIDLVNIDKRLAYKEIVKNLSKGTKQKAVFIVYMMVECDVIIFDEGLENIDNSTLNIIMKELVEWVKAHKICLIATHHKEILEQTSGIIKLGRE